MEHDAKLRNQHGETVDPTQPVPVDTVEAQQLSSITDSITYNGKAVAGAISINSTKYKPIITVEGDQVASHWDNEKNKIYEAIVDSPRNNDPAKLISLVETNGSAAVVVYNETADLEKLTESVTGTVKRYVLKATDTKGAVLYGWIFGVAVSGNVYTFDIVNNRLTETRNWVGSLSSFDNTKLYKIEIFKYNSSLVFGTGTTATEEVTCPREYSKSWKATLKFASENLTNGQYIVDYMRGRIITKKSDTTASEAITYNVWLSTVGGTGSGGMTTTNVTQLAGQTLKQGVTIASSVVTGEQNVLPEAIYRTTPLSKIDGQVSAIESDSVGNQKITQATWERGADMVNDVIKVQQRATKSAPITASALVFTGAGQLMGWVVNSCTAGATVKIWDNTTAATTVAFDTMTYTAAVNQGPAVVLIKDVQFTQGCYFTLSGTISLTPLFNQL